MSLWSFALAGLGIAQIYLTGKRIRFGWIVGLLTSALWCVYALATDQYGFIASAAVFAALHYRNWKEWGDESR